MIWPMNLCLWARFWRGFGLEIFQGKNEANVGRYTQIHIHIYIHIPYMDDMELICSVFCQTSMS